MIDYLNSRMLISIASVAFTGIIISASIFSADIFIREYAEDVASLISEIVNIALNIGSGEFECRVDIETTTLCDGLIVRVFSSHVSVEIDHHRSLKEFDSNIYVMSDGKPADELIAREGDHLWVVSRGSHYNGVNVAIELGDDSRSQSVPTILDMVRASSSTSPAVL